MRLYTFMDLWARASYEIGLDAMNAWLSPWWWQPVSNEKKGQSK